MDYTTSTTALEAVNVLLGAIAEAPVNTLVGNTSASVARALEVIARVSREVQTAGWSFNTDYGYTLTADANGKIILPSNILTVKDVRRDGTPPTQRASYVVRGGELYDNTRHTGVFTVGETVTIDVTVLLPLEALPEIAKTYIVARAVRYFVSSTTGDITRENTLRADENEAFEVLKASERQRVSGNIKQSAWFNDLRRRVR